MKDLELIIIIVVMFFALGCSVSCGGMKEGFTATALNSQGCPTTHPNRSQLLVHKNANYKYCYQDRSCINWATRLNEKACNAYTEQEPAPSDFDSEVQARVIETSSPYDVPADESGKLKIRGVQGQSFGTQSRKQFSNKTLRECAAESMKKHSGGMGRLGHFEWKHTGGNKGMCQVNAGWELTGAKQVGTSMGAYGSVDSGYRQYCVEATGKTNMGSHNAGCAGIRDKGRTIHKPVKTCTFPENSESKGYGCGYKCNSGFYKDNGQCAEMNDEMKAACANL